MPQFDFYVFASIYLSSFLFFILTYLFIIGYLLPQIYKHMIVSEYWYEFRLMIFDISDHKKNFVLVAPAT
jgi:hypothetical protein